MEVSAALQAAAEVAEEVAEEVAAAALALALAAALAMEAVEAKAALEVATEEAGGRSAGDGGGRGEGGTGGGDGGGGWKDSFGEWWTCNPNDHAAGMDDAEWAHFITSAEWKRRHSGELRAERDRWKNNRGQARSRARKGDSGKVARRQAEAASREAKRQRMAADAADALCGMGGQ